MGVQNKLLIEVGGQLILKRVLMNLLESDVDEILVVTGNEDMKISAAIQKNSRIRIAHNKNFKTGMTSSIKTGVKASDDSDFWMICLGDMPFIQSKDYNLLLSEAKKCLGDQVILMPSKDGVWGNPKIFSNHFYSEIVDCKEKDGCKSVVTANKEFVHLLETDCLCFFQDIDTKDDLKKYDQE